MQELEWTFVDGCACLAFTKPGRGDDLSIGARYGADPPDCHGPERQSTEAKKLNTTSDLAELRQTIAEGAYVVDTEQVAGTIARKLAEVDRIRREFSATAKMVEAARLTRAAVGTSQLHP